MRLGFDRRAGSWQWEISRFVNGERDLASQELGTKRVCTACEAKFYDLSKNPLVCPKCGHEEAVPAQKAKRKKPAAVVAPVPEEKKPEPKAAEKDDGEVAPEGDTSLDELAAKEASGNDDKNDEDDELLAIEDEDEGDSFLSDDDEDEDDVSTLVPSGSAEVGS